MNTFTDTDLTVLEGLDFAPPCQAQEIRQLGECDQQATWGVVTLHVGHGCVMTRLFCSGHLAQYIGSLDRDINWHCGGCAEPVGAGIGHQFFRITSIEAL